MSYEDTDGPELIIGLVGPIGCNIYKVQQEISNVLRSLNYDSYAIELSQGISDLLEKKGEIATLQTLEQKIEGGNKVRSLYEKKGILAAWAIAKIYLARKNLSSQTTSSKRIAYIIRQLKRPEEVDLLRRTYGNKFIIVSIAENRSQREDFLKHLLYREDASRSSQEAEKKAQELMKRDEIEDDIEYGQRLTDIFHLGDVFIDARNNDMIEGSTRRFFQALFGKTDISPTRDEFGCYMAKSASLRSVDLSRQVGAAIFSPKGDLITIGCNENPKPLGGTYWNEDDDKHRDIDRGNEANRVEKGRIVYDFLRVLHKRHLLREDIDPDSVLEGDSHRRDIEKSLIGEITEYGRMVHAEMNAIADAARLGRSVLGATMYVTTFPCHNCAKHIIASGISRLVYVEPYPKSRADLLYEYAITEERRDKERMLVEPFTGVSPNRFFDIFHKQKRTGEDAQDIHEYYENRREPRIGRGEIDHAMNEVIAVFQNFNESEFPT